MYFYLYKMTRTTRLFKKGQKVWGSVRPEDQEYSHAKFVTRSGLIAKLPSLHPFYVVGQHKERRYKGYKKGKWIGTYIRPYDSKHGKANAVFIDKVKVTGYLQNILILLFFNKNKKTNYTLEEMKNYCFDKNDIFKTCSSGIIDSLEFNLTRRQQIEEDIRLQEHKRIMDKLVKEDRLKQVDECIGKSVSELRRLWWMRC